MDQPKSRELAGADLAKDLIDGLLGGGKFDTVLASINEGNYEAAATVILAHVRASGKNEAVIRGINKAGHALMQAGLDTPERLGFFGKFLVTGTYNLMGQYGIIQKYEGLEDEDGLSDDLEDFDSDPEL